MKDDLTPPSVTTCGTTAGDRDTRKIALDAALRFAQLQANTAGFVTRALLLDDAAHIEAYLNCGRPPSA